MTKKILWISNYGFPNSYALVTRTLLSAFIKRYPGLYEFHLLCIGQIYDIRVGNPIAQNVERDIGIPANRVYTLQLGTREFLSPEDEEFAVNYNTGMYTFESICKNIRPDLIISLNDDGPIILQAQMAARLGIKLIPYLTFDVDHISNRESKMYKAGFTHVLTPAEHSAVIFRDAFGEGTKIQVLPHIIDTELYYKLPASRQELRKKWGLSDSAFVVLAVNRNNIRKRWDLLITAFLEFAKNKPNVHLFIKTDVLQTSKSYTPVNAPGYTFESIRDHSQITLLQREVSAIEMNEIYNIADVGMSATSGEGFGLTSCEMSLCKVPQLVSNNTTAPWIFGADYAGLINCTLHTASIARSFQTLSEIESDWVCIFKSYVHPQPGLTVQALIEPLKTTAGIFTVYVGDLHARLPDGVTGALAERFATVAEAAKFIHERMDDLSKYLRIQVLLLTRIEALRKLDLEPLHTLDNGRKNTLINGEYFKYYYEKCTIGLINVDHAVQLLNKAYVDPEWRRELGEQCYQAIISKFTHEIVCERTREIFEDLMREC